MLQCVTRYPCGEGIPASALRMRHGMWHHTPSNGMAYRIYIYILVGYPEIPINRMM